METNSEENKIIPIEEKEKEQQPNKIIINGIPEHITHNQILANAIAILPSHYNF